MSAMSDYLEGKVCDNLLRTTTYSPPELWMALFDSGASPASLESGSLTGEISGNAYARVQITKADASWTDPGTDGISTNTGTITFPTATPSGWGTVVYAALCDASTGGNVLIYGTLLASKIINSGDTFQFAIGDFSVTFA